MYKIFTESRKKRFLMRISFIYIFLMVCSIQLFTASSSRGQGLEDIEVTIEVNEGNLISVIKKIELQTELTFAYLPTEVESYNDIAVKSGRQSVKSVLEQALINTHLDYRYVENSVIILPKESKSYSENVVQRDLFSVKNRKSMHVNRRNTVKKVEFLHRRSVFELLDKRLVMNVSGKVLSSEGEPLIGVNILVKGTDKGTATDFNGSFDLADVDENAVLVISYIGYQTQEVTLNGESELTITLLEDSQTLDEVVVVGYGTQKKVNITGAVDVISEDQMENRPVSTVSQVLEGQAPGLQIEAGRNGYEPGASLGINIRGVGSLNGGSPYVLIDGFPGNMDLLNPNDIESISILKDAAASAIYGARAPFGVILITTKGGGGSDKLEITYSNNMSIGYPNNLPDLLDSYTFARVLNEAGDNWGGRSYSNDYVDRIIAYQNQDWDYLKQFSLPDATHFETTANIDNGTWDSGSGHADYDWMDVYFGNSNSQRHNLSVRGGLTNKSTFYFSGSFLDQNGMINYGADSYKRFNILGKISAEITDWMDFRYETRFVRSPREKYNGGLPQGDATYASTFRQLSRTIPTQALYDGYGYYTGSFVPDLLYRGTNRFETTENWHTLATEIRPFKNGKIYGDFAYQSTGIDGTEKNLTMYNHDLNQNPVPVSYTVPNMIRQSQTNSYYWVSNVYAQYDISLKDSHNFSAMAGIQYEYSKNHFMQVQKTNLVVQNVQSLETATGDAISSEALSHWSTQGYFSRIKYNYKEKYLLEANARYDGTSRFQEGNRWGFFPSFSAGWNMDKERFWGNLGKSVNTLKLRASWGQLGNQQVAAYSDLALIPLETGQLDWIFTPGAGRSIGYTSIPSLVSPYLTWETATNANAGMDVSFLNHRLNASFDFYKRVTENMIGPSEPVPGIIGTNVPQSNNATMESIGWELSARWVQKIKNSSFDWFIGLNISDVKSKVTQYLNPSGLITSWYAGKEVGEIWGYTAHELFQTQEEVDMYTEQINLSFLFNSWNTGDLKYEDINGDGSVNPGANSTDNHGDLSIIGNNSPRYQYGISGGINFKDIDFSFLIKGTAKRDFMFGSANSNTRFWGIDRLPFTTLTPEHLDYFRDQPGDKYVGLYEGDANINLDAFWPKIYNDPGQNSKNRFPSTRYLVDASYVRLQNVQIGYSLNAGLLEKLRISNFRIYLSGENLITFSELMKGIDPAALGTYGAGLTYGSEQVYSLGLTISL
ncbi:TonB-dependent receptor [Membranihabitans maritimus]|uniref:TonB-dependent receptor n=1 Tax=Membranihabitans maritimus TaxID=2904244 RepID=UPI001F1D9CAD|nr:TonB-dependent receptor [Membranihabitans maritimus]